MHRLKVALAALALCAAAAAPAAAARTADGEGSVCGSTAFTVDDYFDVKRVAELAMSGDGRKLVYAVDAYGAEGSIREVHVVSFDDGDDGRVVDELADARDFAWIPWSQDLAFLSRENEVTQVLLWQAAHGRVERRTQAADSVDSFRFAPHGDALAFTTRAAHEPGESLYEQFRSGVEGILIDPATTSSHDFVNPHWHGMAKSPPPVLWVQQDGEATRVPVPGVPAGGQSYAWSGDGRYLSVTFVGDDVAESWMAAERTSVGVYDTVTRRFRTIAGAIPPRSDAPAVNYRGGEWIPGERRLLIRRVTERHPWVSDAFPDLTVADATRPLTEQRLRWRPVETYPRGLRFMPLSASEILLANTVRGVHSLFVLTRDRLEKSALTGELDGSSSLFGFSEGYRDVAFVNESLRRPPEVYVARNGRAPERLTALNTGVADKLAYSRREVRWESVDGTRVSGWLLEPEGIRPATGWPTVTHVHGGPAFPFPDAFAPYFSYWPYPLELYAAHGIAVFLPNYRGTHTYGMSIAAGEGDDAVEDIVSGVEYVVSQGLADPAGLGISGHSHGALVGPLAMVRSGMFEASSFAEGVSNSVVMYELMSGDANREIHDPVVGASLYEAPELYLRESAGLQMEGIGTASLFEAGAYMTAIYMLGFSKAAERFGIPAEFIVYPRTGHNISIPALQRESAQRNLDWFRFWLQGCDPSERTPDGRRVRWKALTAREASQP